MTLTIALMTGGREWVLDQLEHDPTWQRVRIKSPEGMASALVTIAKRVALSEGSALILPDIQSWYASYEKTNGSPPNEASDDWYEGHDDGLMALFEPFADTLSGSWLAFTSTDAKLWIDGEDEKLARSFAEEVWKQLTWKRTDNQILAGVGIVHDDLTKYGAMPEQPVEQPKMEHDPMRINAILNRIMLNMPDPSQLAEDLDFASDDDDALAAGAMDRLGITMDDVQALRLARSLAHGAVDAWANAIEAGELLDETVVYSDLDPATALGVEQPVDLGPEVPTSLRRTALPPLPGAASAVSPAPGLPPLPAGTKPLPPLPGSAGTGPAPAKGRKKSEVAPPDGYISSDILRSIKEHSGIKDEDMADMMGISRPTLGNVMKGKGFYVPPDVSRREAIKNMLVMHITKLTDAHAAIS